MELNNITNTGTWGQQVTRLNDNFNKVALGIDTLQEMYESLSQSAIEVVDTLPTTGKANKIYRLVGTTSYSDYMYNTDDLNTPILMATYNNAIENEPTPGSNNLVKSGGVASAIVFDISAYHATGSTLATYADLTSALGTNGANVPSEVRKGGMSIKFVQTSDNKYVQYRLMSNVWSTNTSDWFGSEEDIIIPISENNNLRCVDYSEFLEVKIDLSKNIITGILKDGRVYINKIEVGDYSSIINPYFSSLIKDNKKTPFFLDANIDNDGNVIEATLFDGTKYFNKIKSPSIDKLSQRKSVIIDTDLGADSDDFIELSIICLAAQKGLLNLIGVNLTKWHAGTDYTSATAVDAICSYYGIKNICVGKSSFIATAENAACKAASDFQAHTYTPNSTLETSLEFYKRALLSIPDEQRCDIVIGGFLTGFADLLNYTPSNVDDNGNDISKWSGVKIVKEKVDRVYIIGGYYPNTSTKEWNFSANGNEAAINATDSVFKKCQRPIKFLGVGDSVSTLNCGGYSLYENNHNWSILYKSLYAFAKAKAGAGATEEQIAAYWRGHRCPWGAVISLIIADNNLELSGYSETFGVNVIDTDSESPTYGCNTFTPSEYAKDSYLIVNQSQLGRIEHRIDQLILENNYIDVENINNFKIERI